MTWSGRIRKLAFSVVVASMLLLAACGSSADDVDTAADDQSVDDGGQEAEDTPDSDADTNDTDPDNADPDEADSEGESNDGVDELFPDVIGATAELESDGTWTFSATLSSPYDTPARYADGWRVLGPDGTVYGERPLTHDHQSEQPFTRSRSGIEIPDDIAEVTVEGRDQLSGWGGATAQVTLER